MAESATLRIVQWVCIAVGVALLAFWLVARLHGTLGQRSEIQRFEEAREAFGRPPEAPSAIAGPDRTLDPDIPADTSLWAADRIEEYRESLEHEFEPPLAILRIPSIGLEVAVLPGTSELVLNRGVGHIEGTPLPGEPGNVGIAGHRDGYFRGFKDVEVGEPVELESLSGVERYTITELFIVEPPDVWVLEPTEVPSLTLVTCYPFYYVGSAPKRFIVRAEIVSQES